MVKFIEKDATVKRAIKMHGLQNAPIPPWKILQERAYKEVIEEKYGSFNGQYDAVKRVAETLIKKIENKDYRIEGNTKVVEAENEGIRYVLYWEENKYGDGECSGKQTYKDGIFTIELHIICTPLIYKNVISTIAHEIMHVYQARNLDVINGINARSMMLYNYCADFYNNAPTNNTFYFFYGLYSCFSIEVYANISSVSSYMGNIFKGKKPTTQQIQNKLNENDKYTLYKTILSVLKDCYFTDADIEYVKQCLCMKRKNNYKDGEPIEPVIDNVNIDFRKFVEVNRKQMINICKKTIVKMQKNVIDYFEHEKIKY